MSTQQKPNAPKATSAPSTASAGPSTAYERTKSVRSFANFADKPIPYTGYDTVAEAIRAGHAENEQAILRGFYANRSVQTDRVIRPYLESAGGVYNTETVSHIREIMNTFTSRVGRSLEPKPKLSKEERAAQRERDKKNLAAASQHMDFAGMTDTMLETLSRHGLAEAKAELAKRRAK